MVGHTYLDFRLRWTLGLYTHLSWGGISDTIQLTLWYPRTTTLRNWAMHVSGFLSEEQYDKLGFTSGGLFFATLSWFPPISNGPCGH